LLLNSYAFLLIFLPVSVGVYWLLPRPGLRRGWLLLANLAFYSFTGLPTLILLLGLTAGVYLGLRRIERSGQAHRGRTASILIALALLSLGLFKYSGFVVESLNALLGSLGIPSQLLTPRLPLPLGISYYTFNIIGSVLDVLKGRPLPSKSPLDLLTYTAFFPTIGSGPLIRYPAFHKQFTASVRGRHPNWELGVYRIIVGLAKKILIADAIGRVIDPLLVEYGELGFWSAWVITLSFAYQLYFDFSGYTDMAMGVGTLLGFEVPPNFNAPFSARNIADFWERWHITLSHWFRDYFFLPLSRRLLMKWPRLPPGLIRTLTLGLTMTLVGFWHGASWTFILWGVYQGLLLAVHAQGRNLFKRSWPLWVARPFTFLAVIVGFLAIRVDSFPMAASLYRSMLGLNGFEAWAFGIPLIPGVGRRFALLLAVLFVVTNIPVDTWKLEPRRGIAVPLALAALFVFSLLFLSDPRVFIYFQF
jgi:alginate O-acetyltransferase complex protein AlgI